MADVGIAQQHLAAANVNFGRNIEAALALGDMSFLGPDIAWVEALLVNHYHMPVNLLGDYLQAYASAASESLGPMGDVIVNWLVEISGALLPARGVEPSATEVSQA